MSVTMLKKIPVERLKAGMFIHELCGDWMSHPFWRARFKLNGGDDLQRIVGSGIRHVYIDTDKGLDDAEAVDAGAVREAVEAQMVAALATPEPAPLRVSVAAELDRARRVHEQAHQVVRGMMHGCGHDGHTTMLVGAARYLAATRNFEGSAVLIFQPGEEGFAGAKAMIDDGLFDRFPVEAVYAMHNWPALPAGTIGINRGPMMAAADRIEIVIQGRGGHGAHPYLAIDPVLVAAHIITAAQSLVARNVSPIDNAVVSLCSMHAGEPTAYSVIPREARLVGTVRTFRREVQDMIEERLGRLVESVALGFGATARLKYLRSYPATINSEREAVFAADTAAALVGEQHVVRNLPPSMGAEDFSFMLQVKPGAYLRLGQGGEGSCFLHNSRYDFNDEVLPLGAALFASLVERSLAPVQP